MNKENSNVKQKIIDMLKENNGYITSKEVTANNISREYINILIREGKLEKLARGVYYDKNMNALDDPYLTFQLTHPDTVFSHFTALEFHGMTEAIPYIMEITTKRNKYSKDYKKYHVYYVKAEILKLGMEKVKTSYGNYVNAYDRERCVCDIIRSINRQDIEQVQKVLRNYSNQLDIMKLSEYAKKMGIYNKVMDYVRRYIY